MDAIPVTPIGLALISVCATLSALAQSGAGPAVQPLDLVLDTWSTHEGLPQNSIYDIAQTDDGFLWLCTDDGLTRFDGSVFKHWTVEDGFSDNSTQALHLDQGGRLWVGTYDGGVNIFDGGAVTQVDTSDGLIDNRVWAVDQTSDGVLWIATNAGISFGYPGRPWSRLTAEHGLPDPWVRSLLVDSHDAIWIGTESGGLAEWNGSQLKRIVQPPQMRDASISAIHQGMDGQILVGTKTQGLWRVAGNELQPLVPDALAGTWVKAILTADDGSIWVGTTARGLARVKDGTVSWINRANGLPSNEVNALFLDAYGSVWVGTIGGGLAMLRERRVKVLGRPEGLAGDWAFCATEDQLGRMWVSTKGGVDVIDGGTVHHLGLTESRAETWVYAMMLDRDGRMWLGLAGEGVLVLDEHMGVVRRIQVSDGLAGHWIFSFAQLQDGRVAVGSDRGVSLVNGDGIENLTADKGLPSGDALVLRVDHDRLLIGSNRGLFAFADGRVEPLPLAGIRGQVVVLSLLCLPDKTLVGTEDHGLVVLHADGRSTQIGTQSGLPHHTVYQILGQEEHIWLSTGRGVATLKRSKLEGTLSSPFEFALYDRRDGMRSEECNGGSQPSGIVASDGTVWFPTIQGFVGFPSSRVEPEPVRAFVDSVVVDGETLVVRNAHVSVGPRPGRLEIDYSAIGLRVPGKTRFKFKLDGVDKDWVDAGTRRRASYTRLPHGTHNFRVIAANEDGVWGDPEDAGRLQLEVATSWLRSPWLIVPTLLACVALFASAFFKRRNREDQTADGGSASEPGGKLLADLAERALCLESLARSPVLEGVLQQDGMGDWAEDKALLTAMASRAPEGACCEVVPLTRNASELTLGDVDLEILGEAPRTLTSVDPNTVFVVFVSLFSLFRGVESMTVIFEQNEGWLRIRLQAGGLHDETRPGPVVDRVNRVLAGHGGDASYTGSDGDLAIELRLPVYQPQTPAM